MAIVGQVFDFSLENSSLIGMIQKIDSFTDVGQGGVLGILFILVIGGILFLMMRAFGNEKAFPVAMLVTSVLGILVRILGFINDQTLYVCIGLLIVSVLLLIREQGQYEG